MGLERIRESFRVFIESIFLIRGIGEKRPNRFELV